MGKTFQKERMNKEVAEEDRKKSVKPKTTTKRTTDATKKVADKAAAALIKKPTDTEAAAPTVEQHPEYKRKQKLLDGDPDEIPFLPKYVQQHIEDFGRPPFRVPNMKRNHKTMEEFMEKYRNK